MTAPSLLSLAVAWGARAAARGWDTTRAVAGLPPTFLPRPVAEAHANAVAEVLRRVALGEASELRARRPVRG